MSALELIKKAKAASRSLGLLSTAQKNEVLKTVSVLLTERTAEILEANKIDLVAAKQLEMALGLQDRLTLTPERIDSLKFALA